MNQIIRIEDIQEFASISGSVSDEKLSPLIKYCELIELPALIGSDLISDILNLDRESEIDQATDKYIFWKDYVRAYAALFVFVELLNTHGFNIKNESIITFTDSSGGSLAVSGKERGDLIQQYSKIKAAYMARLLNQFIVKKSQTLDSIRYAVDPEANAQARNQHVGIFASRGINERLINDSENRFRL